MSRPVKTDERTASLNVTSEFHDADAGLETTDLNVGNV